MWPAVVEKLGIEQNLLFKELVFRSAMVLLTCKYNLFKMNRVRETTMTNTFV